METYEQQGAWRAVEARLPAPWRFDDEVRPREEVWQWEQHAVHLDRFDAPSASAKVIALHGVGTNGRLMSLIVGAPLRRRGFATVSVDLPGYGLTASADGRPVRYDDWVTLVDAFVDAESRRDGLPIVLVGLSAGGMLAYQVAAVNGRVSGIVGTCFLDQRISRVRRETARSPLVGAVSAPALSAAARTPLARMRVPIRTVSKMRALANDPQALEACLRDSTSAGTWVSLAFLSSYMNKSPAIEPEQFSACPVLLAQPGRDRWTPLELSAPFIARLSRVPTEVVVLDNAGHFPLEQPGLTQLTDAVASFVTDQV